MSKTTTEQWTIRPDYSQTNVYRLWDDAGNFHDDNGPAAMDRRAALMQAVPDLLAALEHAMETTDDFETDNIHDLRSWCRAMRIVSGAALAQARRKAVTP